MILSWQMSKQQTIKPVQLSRTLLRPPLACSSLLVSRYLKIVSVFIHIVSFFFFLFLILLLTHFYGSHGPINVLRQDIFEFLLNHCFLLLQSFLNVQGCTSSLGSIGCSQAEFGGWGTKFNINYTHLCLFHLHIRSLYGIIFRIHDPKI